MYRKKQNKWNDPFYAHARLTGANIFYWKSQKNGSKQDPRPKDKRKSNKVKASPAKTALLLNQKLRSYKTRCKKVDTNSGPGYQYKPKRGRR